MPSKKVASNKHRSRREFIKAGIVGTCAFAAKACATPRAAPLTQKPNIILISLDSLRPDHLGCHGYFRDTSPNLDRLASEGIRFTNFFSVAGSTLPTHTSTFSGLEAFTHGIIGFNKANYKWPDGAPNLLRSLGEQGYRRGGIIGEFAMACCPAWTRSFFDDLELDTGNKDGQATQGVVEKGLHWIQSSQADNPDQPFFLYLYTGDIHTRKPLPDYQTAPEYMSLWTKDPNPNLLGLTPEERTQIIAQYDACIRYTDHWMGEFFKGVQRQGLESNTVILVMSDHGDLLWDQGGPYFGHQFLYDSVLRSVLLMRGPGIIPSGKAMDCLANHSNLAPTIADLAGIPPIGATDGQSLVPAIRGQKEEIRETVFAHRIDPDQYSVRSRDWKYTRTDLPEDASTGTARFLRERAPKGVELFDMQNDAAESKNVVEEHPEKAVALRQALNDLLKGYSAKSQSLGFEH